MSRNNTQALQNIRMLCRMQQIDEKILYDRSRLILSIYRDVCWSARGRAEEVYDDLICTCGSSLDRALIYLENAMGRIREYPCRGDLYCEILSKCYLSRFKYKETEMLEMMDMERSTYYDRKKEAVLLFGLSLWGNAIPMLKDFLVAAQEDVEFA